MAFNSETAREAGKKSKRPKDSSYKTLKDKIADIVDDNIDQFNKWMIEVGKDDPAKACDLYIKLLSFHVPKVRSIELKEPIEKKKINLPPWMTTKNPPEN